MQDYLSAELSATCAALGYYDGKKYHLDRHCLDVIKDLIKYLKRDDSDHTVRRYLGQAQLLQTDLIKIFVQYPEKCELWDVLLRLMINLTSPALVVYNEDLPTEKISRSLYQQVVLQLQGYKVALADDSIWTVVSERFGKILNIDSGERGEENELIIERILTLIRNVLQIPPDDNEKRTDNDATIHDEVLFALHASGLVDLLLFIASNSSEQQYHMQVLEIISLMLREQSASRLSNVGLQRTAAEKERDGAQLQTRRDHEIKQKMERVKKYAGSRHSRFGGTFVVQNMKAIGENQLICHKPFEKIETLEFGIAKKKMRARKKKVDLVDSCQERTSALSVRMFLKEFCVEFLNGAYNPIMRYAKSFINGAQRIESDTSHYLWALRFFMEFNRHYKFQVKYVSETISKEVFYLVQSEMQNFYERMNMDKKNISLWFRQLHLALKAYRELLHTLMFMDKSTDNGVRQSAKVIKSNIFYQPEYREVILGQLLSYNEQTMTRAYLVDLIETVHIFLKMLEQFCSNTRHLIVQKAEAKRRKAQKRRAGAAQEKQPSQPNLEELWDELGPEVSAVLYENLIPEVRSYDATISTPMEDQKMDVMKRVQKLLHNKQFEQAIGLLRSARTVWPDNDYFGRADMPVQEEFLALREIFTADLGVTYQQGLRRLQRSYEASVIESSTAVEDSSETDSTRKKERKRSKQMVARAFKNIPPFLPSELEESAQESTEVSSTSSGSPNIKKRKKNPKTAQDILSPLSSRKNPSGRQLTLSTPDSGRSYVDNSKSNWGNIVQGITKNMQEMENRILKKIESSKRSILYDVEKKFEALQNTISINSKQCPATEMSKIYDKIGIQLPTKTLCDFNNLDKTVSNDTEKKVALTVIMSSICKRSTTFKEAIGKILGSIMNKDVQLHYSACGRQQKGRAKENLSKTTIYQILKVVENETETADASRRNNMEGNAENNRDNEEECHSQEYEYDEEEDEESERDIQVQETDFKFDDFLRRFANVKVVKACAMLLQQFEINSDEINHCTVKLLHRIAWECKMSPMIFQASIFRTFQRILDSARPQHRELKKFAIYIIRGFIEVAEKNPKSYMELLFWKTTREANDMVQGYGENEDDKKVTRSVWSEVEEDELRTLFMEHQTNKHSKDLIDWILENIISDNRTRRGIIKKLKEMSLIVNSKRVNSEIQKKLPKEWSEEEIAQLTEIWDQVKGDDDPVDLIYNGLRIKRTKANIKDKLLELSLVESRAQLRKRNTKKSNPGKSSWETRSPSPSSVEDDSDEEENQSSRRNNKAKGKRENPSKKKISRKQPVILYTDAQLSGLLKDVIENNMKDALEWVKESMEEVLEDRDEESVEGIPLVPITDYSTVAMDSPSFQRLLRAIGIQSPTDEQEAYWRIPSSMLNVTIRRRCDLIAAVLAGQFILEEPKEPAQEKPEINSSESDDDGLNVFESVKKFFAPNQIESQEKPRPSSSQVARTNSVSTSRLPKKRSDSGSGEHEVEKVVSDNGATDSADVSERKLNSSRIKSLVDSSDSEGDEMKRADLPDDSKRVRSDDSDTERPLTKKRRVLDSDEEDDTERPEASQSRNTQKIISDDED